MGNRRRPLGEVPPAREVRAEFLDSVFNDSSHPCGAGAIHECIRYDHEQARQIEPTGRHRKALQWYRDDIQNAENDLRTCRR